MYRAEQTKSDSATTRPRGIEITRRGGDNNDKNGRIDKLEKIKARY